MQSLGLIWLLTGLATTATVHVSPTGDDAGDGSAARPLKTLTAARDATRKLPRTEPVEVVVAAGTYELSAPLALAAEDSRATWRAVGEVRLVAGRMVSGWTRVTDEATLARLDETARGHVLRLDLKAQGVTDYGRMSGGFGQGGSTGLELFCDDAPMSVSRYPNEGFIRITEVLGPTEVNIRGTRGCKEGIFRCADPRVARWAAEREAMVLGYWFWDWADQRQAIERVEPETLTLTLAKPDHGYGYRKGQWFYGFNLLGEIDRPGEWYLDRQAGVAYLWPLDDKIPTRTMVSVLPEAITLDGARELTLRGFVIEGARGTGVVFRNCRESALIGCTVRNLGGWAIRVEGGQQVTIRDCDLTGMGNGGISLAGGDRATLTPAGHVAENNHIHHYSRWNRTYQAGLSLNGVGQVARHNLIHDAPHQAMNFGGNDHRIEFNELHNVCEESNDAGTIYAWCDWSGRGNVIRHNYIHHIYGHEGRGANGVYLDDCFSSAEIEGNVFERVVQRPIHLGGGRDHRVVNNLFIDCDRALHIDARGLGWRAYGYDELKGKLEKLPYTRPPWSERYPTLVNLLDDEPMAPKGNLVERNIVVGGRWDDIEGKAKPYVTLRDNLLEADREILRAVDGRPTVDLDAAAVKGIGFVAPPVAEMGLRPSADRPTWPPHHPVTRHERQVAESSATQPHPGPPLRLARGSATIDGTVAPDEYPGEPVTIAEDPGRQAVERPATARLALAGDVLQVAVTVPADPARLVRDGAWGQADAVEICFRVHDDKQPGPTFIVQGYAGGRLAVSRDAGAPAEASARLAAAVTYRATIGADSWTGEWAIPLTAAGITVKPGLVLGFNLGARRLAGDQWLVWRGARGENWRLDNAGRAILP